MITKPSKPEVVLKAVESALGVVPPASPRIEEFDREHLLMEHAADLEREIAARQQIERALAERVRQGLLVGEVGAALTQSNNLEEMLQLCAAALVKHLDVAFARIWTLNEAENVLELRASAGLYTHLNGPHSRVPFGMLKIGMIAETRKPHFTNDVLADPHVNDKVWAKREGMVAFAGYPLVVGARLVGVVGMFARAQLSTSTLASVGSVAQEVALGIERKRAEEALRSSEEQTRLILDTANDPFIAIGMDGQVLTWNRQAEITFGWSREEALGRKIAEMIIPPANRDAHEQGLTAFRTTGTGRFLNQHIETTALRRNGREFPVELIIWPVRAGGTCTINAFVRDITERKSAGEEESKLRTQLLQAQKMESLGRLAGGVAHDFNNLLTVINGYGDVLLKELSPGDAAHSKVREIRKAGERAAVLARELLVVSRKQIIEPKIVNLNEIVVDVAKMLERVIGEDIRLESKLSPSLGSVLADPGQLHQVLMNLAINSRDAMENGGTLLIETDNVDLDASYVEQHLEMEAGSYVQLKVTDSGVGMTNEVVSHVFEPFFTTKKPGEGTGLGLATAYGIVKQSGGSIWVYSEPGEGTTFTIYLPRVDQPVIVQDEPKPVPETLRGTETILVVEDQAQVRELVLLVLRSYGYEVIEAADPSQAKLSSERYTGQIHLMLTDIVMPGMTGFELADQLKPRRPDMAVLFMSGYSERAIADRSILERTGGYLAKPFSPESLAKKVRELLGSPSLSDTILVVDDESEIRNFLRTVLTGAGYQVLEAKDGKDALQEIEASEVDLVIMDLAMPEQEGIETLQTLHRKHPRLKVIAISGRFDGSALDAARHLGALATLPKPFGPDALLLAVRRAMLG